MRLAWLFADEGGKFAPRLRGRRVQEEASMASVFGSDNSTAVPGGNFGKPLMIALLALLAARYFGKGSDKPAQTQPTPSASQPDAAQNPSPGSLLDGLGGLIEQFQKKGLGETIDTWVNPGKNKDVSPGEVSVALGNDMVEELSRRTGLSRQQVVDELARMLPNVVDRLTPDGRLPSKQEMARLMAD
jgi:uncharacterized protein YidB (DUF937 family)